MKKFTTLTAIFMMASAAQAQLSTAPGFIPFNAAPTTTSLGRLRFDTNAWDTGRGALQIYDGTATTWVVAVLASDTPGNGEVPTWNTGGTITWEAGGGGGATAYDDIADPDANSTIAFAGFTNLWTSTLDNGIVFELSDTDADAASATTLLKLSHNDGADADVTYLSMIGDKDGTPTNDFLFTQSGFTATLPIISSYSPRVARTNLSSGTALTVGTHYWDTLSAIRTLTFSGTPADGDEISLELVVTGGPHVLTVPTSYRVGSSSTTTSISLPTGNHLIKWLRINSTWVMSDSGVDAEAAYTVFGNPTAGALAPVFTASPIVTNLTVNALLTLPQSDDPDIASAGQLSWDTDGWLRAYDGTNQVAVGRKIETIQVTVITPNDLADAQRDAFLVWSNESGMDFVVTGWKGWAGTDDTTLNLEEVDSDGVSNNATVDAVELATGSGPYTGSDTTITAATIENGHLLVLDFDDTDTPTYVKMTIYGYYNANVN